MPSVASCDHEKSDVVGQEEEGVKYHTVNNNPDCRRPRPKIDVQGVQPIEDACIEDHEVLQVRRAAEVALHALSEGRADHVVEGFQASLLVRVALPIPAFVCFDVIIHQLAVAGQGVPRSGVHMVVRATEALRLFDGEFRELGIQRDQVLSALPEDHEATQADEEPSRNVQILHNFPSDACVDPPEYCIIQGVSGDLAAENDDDQGAEADGQEDHGSPVLVPHEGADLVGAPQAREVGGVPRD
mmetsp:Transcript_59110/g.190116  ORF Transcript_59110/g.190116 Transcript_59110/m.190116 type:complete len:243 (-) Transcript_59110:632-1360(-)